MRNLLLFIARYHLFILFILLQVVAISIYVREHGHSKAVFFNTSNQVTGTYYQTIADITRYFSLPRVNRELADENARLRAMLKESQYADTGILRLKQDSTLRQKYLYISAEVLRNTVNYKNNFLTLNRGSRHGITEGMGVISPNGVVGMVHKVSQNFCSVLSLLNSNTRIPPKIADSNYFGTLVWEGKDPRYASLIEVNMHVPVKVGQQVSTSGYSSVYPENIPIGVIEEKNLMPGSNFYNLKVKLYTSFQNLKKVYIVKNLYRAEQDSLENNPNIPAFDTP